MRRGKRLAQLARMETITAIMAQVAITTVDSRANRAKPAAHRLEHPVLVVHRLAKVLLQDCPPAVFLAFLPDLIRA